MSDPDAYPDEMGYLRPRDIHDSDFSALVEEVRSAYLREPDPEVAARHLAAIAEQARAVPPTAAERRAARRGLGTTARLGVVAVGFALLSGGLALAGVDLPGLPEVASEANRGDAKVPSPDQLPEAASETARSVLEAIETNLPLKRAGDISGCEFGAMISAAARGVEADTSHCTEGGSSAKGEEASAKGKARAEAAKAAGRAKGEAASGGKADPGGVGSEASAEGRAKAEAAKAAGEGNAPNK